MTDVVDRYNARARDYMRWWAPVLAETSRRVVDYVEWYAGGPPGGGATVVELGTGSGTLAEATLERWPTVQVIATDIAAGMIDVARERLARYDEGRLRLIEAPAAAVPLADASVDVIVSSFVLQLVPDRLRVLREGVRVLRPGGVFAYVTWIDRDNDDFEPRLEFDEAVLDLKVEEPAEGRGRYAGDVASAGAAAKQLRRAGLRHAVARDDELEYDWTLDSYLEYKLSYDETTLIEMLNEDQRRQLETEARKRLSRLRPEAFRWRAPVVFAAARK